ncbi:hypothetical protein A2U01_0058784, partial [Trifolium medium]|nr:hypothetical protein [Trifolium medium]
PDLDAPIKTLLEPKPPDLLLPELLQSESQDSDQLATMLPRRGPPPEHPDTSPPQSPVANILIVGKDSISNEPRYVHADAEGGKDQENLRAKLVFCNLNPMFNLMG